LQAVDGVHARVAFDADAMAQAIVHTLNQAAESRAMGEAARALVRDGFDWSRAATQLEAVYASLASPKARAA